MNIHTRHKRNSRTVTQIEEDEFLIEGETDYARLGFEVDPSLLTFADISGGPFLHVGKDFFGKGKILSIEPLDSGRDGYIIIKVRLQKQQAA